MTKLTSLSVNAAALLLRTPWSLLKRLIRDGELSATTDGRIPLDEFQKLAKTRHPHEKPYLASLAYRFNRFLGYDSDMGLYLKGMVGVLYMPDSETLAMQYRERNRLGVKWDTVKELRTPGMSVNADWGWGGVLSCPVDSELDTESLVLLAVVGKRPAKKGGQ